MKKLIQLSLAIVLSLTLLMGLFWFAPDITPNVGWNKGIGMSPSQSLQVAGYCATCTTLDSRITPNAGWNKG